MHFKFGFSKGGMRLAVACLLGLACYPVLCAFPVSGSGPITLPEQFTSPFAFSSNFPGIDARITGIWVYDFKAKRTCLSYDFNTWGLRHKFCIDHSKAGSFTRERLYYASYKKSAYSLRPNHAASGLSSEYTLDNRFPAESLDYVCTKCTMFELKSPNKVFSSVKSMFPSSLKRLDSAMDPELVQLGFSSTQTATHKTNIATYSGMVEGSKMTVSAVSDDSHLYVRYHDSSWDFMGFRNNSETIDAQKRALKLPNCPCAYSGNLPANLATEMQYFLPFDFYKNGFSSKI